MTTYLINQRILFNDEDGSLKHVGDDNPAHMLAAPAARLFLYLITYNRTNVSREDILRDVWEKNGLVSSNNNLNHYISILRKALAIMEEKDIILTLPKVGFSLHANIEEFPSLPPENIGKKTYPNMDIASSAMHVPSEQNTLPSFSQAKLSIFIIAITLMLAVLVSTYYFISDVKAPVLPTSNLLGKIDNCDIYKLGKTSVSEYPQLLSLAKSNIARYSLNCTIPSDVYFYGKITHLQSANIENDIIFYCPKNGDVESETADCLNIKYNSEP